MKNVQLLKDPEQAPDDRLFRQILNQEVFLIHQKMKQIFDEYGLLTEWRYYNDGKAWLWKVTRKTKTIVWISLWEDFFKSSFYFTEKTRLGIDKLEISDGIKSTFTEVKPMGKLVPLILDIQNIDELNDFEKIIAYKLSLK